MASDLKESDHREMLEVSLVSSGFNHGSVLVRIPKSGVPPHIIRAGSKLFYRKTDLLYVEARVWPIFKDDLV